MTINSEFFNRRTDEVGKDFVGRKLSRKIDGVLTEGVILKVRVYTHPGTKIASPELNDEYKNGSVWINSRRGYLLMNISLFENMAYLSLAEIAAITSGHLTSVIESSWIAPHFGLGKDANGKQITDLFEIGNRIPGTALVTIEPRQSENYVKTFYIETPLKK